MIENKLFYFYLFFGFILGVMIEVINYNEGNPAGIGLIAYCIVLILYHQKWGRRNEYKTFKKIN